MRSIFSSLNSRVRDLVRRFPAWALSIIVFVFYLYTLAPSIVWADGARVQMDVMLKGSSYAYMEEVSSVPTDGWPFDRLGVAAWDHPLYVMLAQVFLLLPGKEPSYLINLMSAVMGALAVGVTYQLAVSLVHDPWAAAVGSLALAVSHTFWFHSVTAQTYTLNILFMAILVGQVFSWAQRQHFGALYSFSLVAGLGLANHRLFGLIAVLGGVSILWSARDRRELMRAVLGPPGAAMAVLFLLGLAPWWMQFIRIARILGVPLTWELAGTYSLIEHRLVVGFWGRLAGNLGSYLVWLLYQFTPLGLVLGVIGFRWMWKNHSFAARFLLSAFVAYILFSANFSVADNFNFHLPSYWIFSLGIACGAGWLQIHWRETGADRRIQTYFRAIITAGIVLLPILIYAITPLALERAGITEANFGIYPIGTGVRDTARYFLNPDKRGDNSAAVFGRTTMSELAPHALVLTPRTSEQDAYVVLRYVQRVEGMRPDVRLDMLLFSPIDNMPQAVLDEIKSQIPCRPVYLTSLNPKSFPVNELEASYDIVPEANLFRLIPLRLPDPPSSECSNPDRDWPRVTLAELIRRALRWP